MHTTTLFPKLNRSGGAKLYLFQNKFQNKKLSYFSMSFYSSLKVSKFMEREDGNSNKQLTKLL